MIRWRHQIPLCLVLNVLQIIKCAADCQVLVPEPWPKPYLFVPNGSSVEIICTSVKENRSPSWSIDLASQPGEGQFQFGPSRGEDLNANGVFDIEIPGMPSTRRLLINNTAVNNQTIVYCDRLHITGAFSKTILFVFDPLPVTLGVVDNGVDSVKLIWSEESLLSDVIQTLSLVVSHGSMVDSLDISLNESYFTAPEGAPPCEIYNFSVLNTTYVGATYTGAGCSVPGPVLSTMLPSLPNISRLDSSLDYALMKQSTGFALYISFEPANYCKMYSVLNYTLEVNGEILLSVLASSVENFSIGDYLSENAVYSFRIHVANTVGVVSTSNREFYTTDVQAVTATLIEGVNTSTIQCEFIEDSNASGCKIVLTTKNGQNVYYNLRKNQNANSTILAVTLELPPPCYSGVEAFDIESDGSVGTLAIPGHIVNPSQVPCTPSTLPGTVLEAWMIAVISVVAVVILLTAVIIVIVCVCKSKKYQERVLRCPCMFQCSADAQVGEEQHLPDELKDDAGESITAAEGGMKTACSDMPTNCQLEEPASLHSEIASTSKLGECTTPGGGGGKCETVYSKPGSKGPPSKRGKTSVPLEEKLYYQPVGSIERTPGDGADYCRTSYCQQTPPVLVNGLFAAAQYAILDQNKDHIYFTLEPPPPVATSAALPPIYQEITEISTSRGVSATRAVMSNGGSNIPLSSASPSHEFINSSH